ncbi:hypothetical protein NEAUS04_0766 [Nematocida ausubeli]|nr:hypothetical protein NEAUS06_0788 [Nematocida ausubeli]KAI5134096.1 hypothetical protein NEAUS07_0709 [Nematocida ausubeli]KAI5146558.1 hypothetical protein NEAUS05_0006 [Nematocida ausubeli]KAI5161894.1 hypothetical protein NEAUS04_0766 [Nematocida ausubeli]
MQNFPLYRSKGYNQESGFEVSSQKETTENTMLQGEKQHTSSVFPIMEDQKNELSPKDYIEKLKIVERNKEKMDKMTCPKCGLKTLEKSGETLIDGVKMCKFICKTECFSSKRPLVRNANRPLTHMVRQTCKSDCTPDIATTVQHPTQQSVELKTSPFEIMSCETTEHAKTEHTEFTNRSSTSPQHNTKEEKPLINNDQKLKSMSMGHTLDISSTCEPAINKVVETSEPTEGIHPTISKKSCNPLKEIYAKDKTFNKGRVSPISKCAPIAAKVEEGAQTTADANALLNHFIKGDGSLNDSAKKRLEAREKALHCGVQRKPSIKNRSKILRSDPPINIIELIEDINKLPKGKASGISGISNELIQHLPPCAVEKLVDVFQLIWDQGCISDDWKKAIIIPIPMEGDLSLPENNRPIMLHECMRKLFEGTVLKRIQKNIKLSEYQCSFKKKPGKKEKKHNLNDILASQPKTARNVCFIDIKQAYNSIDRELLYEKIKKEQPDVSDKTLNIIQELFDHQNVYVKTAQGRSAWKHPQLGVGEGSRLSPLLIGIFINSLPEWITEVLGQEKILLYIDGIAIIGKDQEELQLLYDMCNEWFVANKMDIGPKESVFASPNKNLVLKHCDVVIKKVQTHPYLKDKLQL